MVSDATVLPGSTGTIPETAETTESGEGQEKAFSIDDVKRTYFPPTDLESAQEYLDKISDLDVTIKRNFRETDDKGNAIDWPEGFGLGVIPISRREGDKNVTQFVAVCKIPDVSAVVSHEKGEAFISNVVSESFMTKAANAFRPRPDGSVAASVPETLEDFITSQRGREGLKTFTEIGPDFVKALKKKGIKFMTLALLRQTLQSQAFAASQFEKIHKESWEKILDMMATAAKAKGLDPQVLLHWKETRDEAVAMEVDDDAIDAALADLA